MVLAPKAPILLIHFSIPSCASPILLKFPGARKLNNKKSTNYQKSQILLSPFLKIKQQQKAFEK